MLKSRNRYMKNTLQGDYSERVSIVLNRESRLEKAKKILKVFQDYIGRDVFGDLVCLDIGCSGGIISSFLAKYFKNVIGIDVDRSAMSFAKKFNVSSNARFLIADGVYLPFKNCFFDVVVCNHVYAHVDSPLMLMSEIYRVLKPGGVCYFAAANRLSVIEGNYRLPFLSWFPMKLANFYLRLARGIPVYCERHLTYWGLKRLVKEFAFVDYTLKIISDPKRFRYAYWGKRRVFLMLCKMVAQAFYFFIPTYIWLLIKKEEGSTQGV